MGKALLPTPWFYSKNSRVTDPTAKLPYAFGGPVGTGIIRTVPEDFQVTEQLGFGPSGEGEHVFLRIRKRNLTTHEVAGHIARLAGVRKRDVSFAGLKDRVALTTQVFSVHLPGMPEPDWTELEGENLQVLEAERHRRKVRRGALRGNRFVLRIREADIDPELLSQRFAAVSRRGVPNYFGQQRFGRDGANLRRADQLFRGELLRVDREEKSMLLSSVRSMLFNRVLASRVESGTWDKLLQGEVILLSGSERQFLADDVDEILQQRVRELDINPSGPLCGKPSRSLVPVGAASAAEARVLQGEAHWLEGLQRFGLMESRRPLRLIVSDLEFHNRAAELVVSFSLPSGSYATTVLREVLRISTTTPFEG